MQIIPFEPKHLTQLSLQSWQQHMQRYFTWSYSKALAEEFSFTAVDTLGNVVGCAGLVHEDTTRAYAWVLLAERSQMKLLFFHRHIQKMLKLSHYTRIETVVESNFPQGLRWMKLLGFTCEGEMQHFFGANQHAKLYAYFPHLIHHHKEK